MGQDRRLGAEQFVAGDVIEMIMGVDHPLDRLADVARQRVAERLRQHAVLLNVDDDQTVTGLDRAGVGIAAGADEGPDARRERPQMRIVGDPRIGARHRTLRPFRPR